MGATGSESPEELKRLYRVKSIEVHPDRNPGVDTTQDQRDLNAAYDILRGVAKPAAYDYRSPQVHDPGEGSGIHRTGPQWTAPEPVVITFTQAVTHAGIPGGVDWQFVTERQRDKSGWSSDESTLSVSAFVAYGRTSSVHVFVVAVHHIREDYFVGGTNDKDMWFVKSFESPIKGDEQMQAQWLYRKVVEAFDFPKGEFVFGGRFNSKVLDARDWKFGEKLPTGREMSIKQWLVNSGQVAEDAAAVAGRKHVVELEVSIATFEPKPGHYPAPKSRSNFWDGKYHGDYYQFTLVTNAKNHVLSEADTTKILGTRLGGKSLLTAIFGEYIYSKATKTITRLQKGKMMLEWMADNLTDLPDDARLVLSAAAAQKK